MTQEDKQLLLKDLYARLPYGVKGQALGGRDDTISVLVPGEYPWVKTATGLVCYLGTGQFKPYLRPMSSMTDDEREEIEVFIFNEWYQEDSCKIDKEGWIEILANYDVSGIDPGFCSDYVDWLNEHHFDYRGLIPMRLALEAPKGMYKTE